MTPRPDPHPRLVDTTEAASILGVRPNLVSLWRTRGLITPAGLIPGRGRPSPLYDLAELEPLATRYHQREQHTSNPTGPGPDTTDTVRT